MSETASSFGHVHLIYTFIVLQPQITHKKLKSHPTLHPPYFYILFIVKISTRTTHTANQHTLTECNNCFYTALRIEKCCYIYFSQGSSSSRLKPQRNSSSQRPRRHQVIHSTAPLQMETHTLTCASTPAYVEDSCTSVFDTFTTGNMNDRTTS